jgi:hypothetical protein
MHDSTDASPGRSGRTARCFGCRNRFDFVNLVVLDSGLLCCRRCWRSRDLLEVPGRGAAVEVVG